MRPLILPILGKMPKIASDVFIAPSAEIIGEVEIASQCTIWYGALLRGDVSPIRIGQQTNIQDKVIIHATLDQSRTIIGERVSIGHAAIIHGAQIEDEVLIGMGAIVMDNVHVPKHTIIGAGALVTAGKELESGWIYGGQPAKKLKPMEESHYQLIQRTAENYPVYASWQGKE